jgi:serine protease Do
MDADGRVLGFSARLDPEDKEERLDEPTSFRRGRREFPLIAVLFDEVGPASSLANDPDTRVMPQEETESKRLPWLGVETTGFNKLVAEMLDISAPTRDGARGLLVGRVYPGSPAARAGIEVGDILITAKRTSGPGADSPPMDLEESGGGGGWFSWGGFMGFGDDEAPQPWKTQDTALHRLLKTWGDGTTFDVQYLRKQETKTAALKVEFGPPTFDSAPRKKDEGTGVTVRDMTYEVHASLRLPAGAPGVVVSRTEPGSPGAQARIGKNEIIEEVEAQPVKDAAAFVALLDEARAGGKESVRLVVRRLDKTRLVDLGLAPKEIPGDTAKPDGGDAPADGEDNPGDR